MASDHAPPRSEFDRGVLLDLIEKLDDIAIILLDPAGCVRTWNRGAENLKGYKAEEILGESLSTFYPPEAIVVGHPQRELEAADAAGTYEEEGWRVRKDGTRFWAHVRIVAIYGEDGQLKGYGKMTRDLTERRQAEDQQANVLSLLESTARTDSLTGLPNRRAWDEALERELSRADRSGADLAIALIDIDDFKKVNDAGGHRGGDRFLKQCANSWRTSLRGEDLLARYGGDEFALCLPGCNEEAASFGVARLRATTPAGHSCSVGLAVWDRKETLDSLFGRADTAMYRAKAEGRDRVETDLDSAQDVAVSQKQSQ